MQRLSSIALLVQTEFLGFKRKAKFLLSFLDPALVPTVVESIQVNVATSMQAEMSVEEAMTILGLKL